MARTAEVAAPLTVSPEARAAVVAALRRERRPDRLALWIEVSGVERGQFVYDLWFRPTGEARVGDGVSKDEGVTIVVPAASLSRLGGARLEHRDGSLVLVNPNVPGAIDLGVPADVMEAGLDGPIGRRVRELLDGAVNPRIRSHGGRADVVGVDELAGVVYIELSGGCQGCAMSRVTLSAGIESTLRREIPPLAQVVDVTDHGSGSNPYY